MGNPITKKWVEDNGLLDVQMNIMGTNIEITYTVIGSIIRSERAIKECEYIKGPMHEQRKMIGKEEGMGTTGEDGVESGREGFVHKKSIYIGRLGRDIQKRPCFADFSGAVGG